MSIEDDIRGDYLYVAVTDCMLAIDMAYGRTNVHDLLETMLEGMFDKDSDYYKSFESDLAYHAACDDVPRRE